MVVQPDWPALPLSPDKPLIKQATEVFVPPNINPYSYNLALSTIAQIRPRQKPLFPSLIYKAKPGPKTQAIDIKKINKLKQHVQSASCHHSFTNFAAIYLTL